MPNVAIRCHPGPPRSTPELASWLEDEVERLRAETPRTTTRLSRLTDSNLPAGDHGGWLIELKLPDAHAPVGWGRLIGVLRDMELLGMRPTVLTVASGLGSRQATLATATTTRTNGDDDVHAA
jgi:hypothetical protein